MASERDIQGNIAVIRESLPKAAELDKGERIVAKAILNLVEIALLDLHRIADAAEITLRERGR